MKNLEEIKGKLRELKPILEEKFKVVDIGLFGSYLRADQSGGNDIDVLIEFSEPIGFFEFTELEDFLSERLGAKVDLVMRNSLKPRIKEKILKEAVYV
ncbi:MAG: nucleotidyltransferase family protein [Candidatus Bathyarchaeia archaeon]